MEIKKYLIVKIGALGDVIMALPLAKYIKTVEPGAHITWVVGKTACDLVKLSPYVDKIVVTDDKNLLKGNFFQKIVVLLKTSLRASLKSYAKIITGHTDRRYSLLSLFSIGKRVYFKPKPGASHSQQYIKLFDKNYNNAGDPLGYGADLSKLPETSFSVKACKTIAIAPGGAKNLLRDDNLRRWPMEFYVRLSLMLVSLGYDVILIGGPDDRYCEPFFSKVRCRSFIAKLSLMETLSLLKKSALFIGHDSGPLHMAALTNIPVISIFGPTFKHELLCEKHYHFQGGRQLSCSPCYDGKNYAICNDPVCMREVTPEIIFEKATSFLKEPENKVSV